MDDIHKHGIAESPLEVNIRLAGTHLLRQLLHGNTREQTGQHLLKHRLVQQTVVSLLQLLRLIRPDRVKL